MEEINFRSQLSDEVYNSALKDEQKILWKFFIDHCLPEEAEAVFEAVSGNQDNLNLLTAHLDDKIREMKQTMKVN